MLPAALREFVLKEAHAQKVGQACTHFFVGDGGIATTEEAILHYEGQACPLSSPANALCMLGSLLFVVTKDAKIYSFELPALRLVGANTSCLADGPATARLFSNRLFLVACSSVVTTEIDRIFPRSLQVEGVPADVLAYDSSILCIDLSGRLFCEDRLLFNFHARPRRLALFDDYILISMENERLAAFSMGEGRVVSDTLLKGHRLFDGFLYHGSFVYDMHRGIKMPCNEPPLSIQLVGDSVYYNAQSGLYKATVS